MQHRATAHSMMEKSPAELLFRRRFNTRLPDLRTNPAKDREDVIEAKKVDKLAKECMKHYKDAGRYVKEHDMVVGDLIILKRKTTKHESMYNPQAIQGDRSPWHPDQGHEGGQEAQDPG